MNLQFLITFHRIATQYQKQINQLSTAKLLTVHSDMESGLLGLAHSQLKEFKFQYLVGAEFLPNKTIIVWFNNQGYHTAALTLNLVHNAIVKNFFDDDYGISITNAPLKFLPKNSTDPDPLENIDTFGFLFSILIGFAMSILSASYITFYIKVRSNG